jgi:hypothetical protein
VAVFPATVTVIRPVVAPGGTVTTRLVAVAAVVVAATLLNSTAFADGVGLKPCPLIVTRVPTGPCEGVKLRMAKSVIVERLISRMFPTAS